MNGRQRLGSNELQWSSERIGGWSHYVVRRTLGLDTQVETLYQPQLRFTTATLPFWKMTTMAHWDAENHTIVYADDYADPAYPGWVRSDCGCCAGIRWGGESPVECDNCAGSGFVWKHAKSGALAAWPGGPFLGRE